MVVESSVEVLVEVPVVDVTVDDVTVVVGPSHGQLSGTSMPTEALRHTSASVALTGNVPVGAQMH